jgi:hypothetical protein
MKPQSENDGQKWIESSGGPFLLLPENAVAEWSGYHGDYDRAVEAEDQGPAVELTVGDWSAVVIGDEPLRTTVLECSQLIVRWLYAPSESVLMEGVSGLDLSEVVWKLGPFMDSDGEVLLFDAASPGDEIEADVSIAFRVPTGRIQVMTAEVPLAPHCAARLHYIVSAE